MNLCRGACVKRRRLTELPAIAQFALATFARAMGTAENFPAPGFHAVSDDFAAAVIAFRRNHLDRALEAIEDVCLAVCPDFKRLVVIVSA
jgi:hypothetical protein